jgi:hypothetical protein
MMLLTAADLGGATGAYCGTPLPANLSVVLSPVIKWPRIAGKELTHLPAKDTTSSGKNWEVSTPMLGGGKMKRIYELSGAGMSIRAIARELGISRNTVRKYLCAPEVPKPAPREKRMSLRPTTQVLCCS